MPSVRELQDFVSENINFVAARKHGDSTAQHLENGVSRIVVFRKL